MEKKGLSNIIASVLIVLLVLVGIGIVWAVVQSTLTQTTESVETTKVQIELSKSRLSITKASEDAEGSVNIAVSNRGGNDIDGFLIKIYSNEGEEDLLYDYNVTSLSVYETKLVAIDPQDYGFDKIVKVEVYPVSVTSEGEVVFPSEPTSERSVSSDSEQGPVCGNGVVESGEECDDGDTDDGDGCSSTCLEEDEDGYFCEGEPSQCYISLSVKNAYSVKTHSNATFSKEFYLDLIDTLDGNPVAVEPRINSDDLKIIIEFDTSNQITDQGEITITRNNQPLAESDYSSDIEENNLTITLPDSNAAWWNITIANTQTISEKLQDPYSIEFVTLTGELNSSSDSYLKVDGGDMGAVSSHLNQNIQVDNNFVYDINKNAVIELVMDDGQMGVVQHLNNYCDESQKVCYDV